MKKSVTIAAILLGCSLALWKCSSHSSKFKNTLPANVLPCCTVGIDTFKTWFADKQVTVNGAVTPANSVKFVHNNNCDFYTWAERMFLWVTSPSGSSSVLESPTFYDVSV